MRAPTFRAAGVIMLVALVAIPAGPATAHEDHGAGGHGFLHFSHPLFTESPSPDTKLRVDWFFARLVGEETADGDALDPAALPADFHSFRLEGEYAFTPSLSLEVDLPVSLRDPAGLAGGVSSLDTVDVALKYANFHFADQGLLLGGGIEFGLPTGSDAKGIGSDHIIDIEPFLDFGFQRGALELVGFLSAGLPVNDRPEDGAADAELGIDLSALYHVSSRFALLIELNGEHVYGGEEAGLDVWNLAPGFKVRPWKELALKIGFGVQIPVGGRKEQKIRTLLSVFYHF
ncbi:MAG: hypothetical protein D6740_08750 [Alphaproteobacteria bacterium]|nr:MAG: hypothetical protein D6740_08750 [Alphaproteobacteria bacterium]